jgi:Flp pilus assembly protein TadD
VTRFAQKLCCPLHAYGGLIALGLLTWFGVVHHGIVTYDTAWLMRDNPILAGGELSALPTIWTDFSFDVRQSLGAEFLPVRDTDQLIEFKLFGQNWALHHLGNLLWYLVGCGLFLGICRHLLGPGLPAWSAAALFCVHPLHTENVAWLAGRKDLLGLVFFCGAWWLWLRRFIPNSARDQPEIKPNHWALPVVFLLFVLGFWSKNTTLVLPAILGLCLFTLQTKPLTQFWKQGLLWVGVSTPLLLISMRLGKRMRLFGEPVFSGGVDATALQAQLWYADLLRVVWPRDLALTYPLPKSEWGLGLALLTLAGLWTCAWRLRNRLPILSLGIGVFFLSSLPTSVFNKLQNIGADRYLLLPTLGAALVVGALLQWEQSRPRTPWLQRLSLVLLLPLAWSSHQQTRVWKSDTTLWSASAAAQPNVLKNIAGHARALRDAGQGHLALVLLNQAETRFAEDPQFYQSRGALHLHQGNKLAAESDYRKALGLNPHLRISGNDLAILLSQSDRLAEAIPIAQRVTLSHPLYAKGFITLGALLLDARRLDEAETALLQAEYLAFENANTACNLGNVFWLKMQTDPAARPAAQWWWTACKKRNPGVKTPPGLDL